MLVRFTAYVAVLVGLLAPVLGLGLTPAHAVTGHQVDQVTTWGFPDPSALKVGGRYYAWATGSSGFPVMTASRATGPWTRVGASMASSGLPYWYGEGARGQRHLWAPHVVADKPGLLQPTTYLMFFTATRKGAWDCVGLATSTSPTAGFTSPGRPLLCGASWETVIDPSLFTDGVGRRWLLHKVRHRLTGRSSIRVVQLTDDARAIAPGAQPRELLASSTTEIEAPLMLARDGRVWLFVARDDYRTCRYLTQVYSAASLGGTFRPTGPDNGRLTIRDRAGRALCGPGGSEVIHEVGLLTNNSRIFFHAWANGTPSSGRRVMFTGLLDWSSGTPRLRTT
jgi:beta-xylosidase